ncbi:GDP-mannose transporter GONST2-like isoform X1 [Syzygium oleosum]|uniref:GDP-mannose transporter GONST2-like isoform X1 n=2 Tax=Syzygium oleosum TaxID=219896 RepID=UPI0024B9D12A|nr:GDP-mannose transporter GONST2-like isoform X1 [Syzygium oleosum]
MQPGMPSDFKLDAINRHGYEEHEISHLDGEVASSGARSNLAFRMVDDAEKQGLRSTNGTVSNKEHRSIHDRFFRGNRAAMSESISLPIHDGAKRENGSARRSGPLVSGTAYCISSCSMILLNKVVLSSYNFEAGISLMFYQNLISSVIVAVLGLFGVVSVEKLNWKLIRVWLPVNIIFIGMLVSGMYSLRYINIAMVTILKNVTNILTAIGELYIFRKHQNQKVWIAMFLMIISAITGGITDLSFDSVGYAWQFLNCVFTASYSLTLRRVMDKAKQFTRSGSLNEVSMVLLNNLLSLPFAVFSILLFGEWQYIVNTDVIRMPMFWVVATASGLFGLAISFTSMWFLHQTGPTTYSLVGSLNKIPISIAGLLVFKVPLSVPNFFSILFGLFAGIFFARAKMS